MRSKAIFMALLALAFVARGASVSQEEAVLAAGGWAAEGGALGACLGTRVESAATHVATNGATFYSVKMYGGGTVFMSSDTEMDPVIAFTDSTDDFSEIDRKSPLWALLCRDVSARRAASDTVPIVALPKSTAWPRLIARGEAEENGIKRMLFASPRASAPGDLRVPKLMDSEWDQSVANSDLPVSNDQTCYNYYTPKDESGVIYEGDKDNAVCGCVATAMGQIMFCHKYPEAANASAATDFCWFSEYVNGQVVSTKKLDLPVSGAAYDWSSMVACPKKDGVPLDGRKAIGLLTSDAGRAVGMAYSNEESGSFTFKASKVLVDVFGFGQSVYAEFSKNSRTTVGSLTAATAQSRATLGKVLFANLDAGYPVMLGIENSTTQAGHEIVADGYGYHNGLPYVHLNMGWSGACNVWYNLPEIDTRQAVASLVFNVVSDAVYNIIPEGSARGIMSGRVVDEDGAAVEAAQISVYDSSDVLVTQLVTSATGVWGAALPEDTYRLEVVGADGIRSAEVDGVVLTAPVQTFAKFNWTTPLYEKTGKASDAGSGDYPIVYEFGDLGNSWGNDVTLMFPRVMVLDGSGVTNVYPTLDRAIAGARAIAAADGIAPVMEILRDVDLRADATIDFDCILRAANGVSAAIVTRPSGAAITVASGSEFLVSNCVFAAAGRTPLAVKAGGRLYVGPGFAAERVSAEDAFGFNIAGHVTSDIAVECSVATAVGHAFGRAVTDDPSALSNSVERVYAPFDATGETRGALLESAPGSYTLVWVGAPVPVVSAAAYYVDIYGETNTFAHVDDMLAMFENAVAAGLVGPSPEIVVVGSDAAGFSRDLVVSADLTIRGEGGAVLLPGIYSHIVVTNGGSLLLKDIAVSDRTSDTFIRVLDGGSMTLGAGARLANLVCTANAKGADWQPAGPVYVATNGVLRLESGSKIVGCSAIGVGGDYGGSQGGGVYLDNGATLDLAGGEISGCRSGQNYGGGVYANMGATVVVSGLSKVQGNTGKGGRPDDVYFLGGSSYTNRLWVASTGSAAATSIGVKYSTGSVGVGAGFVFAEADSAVAAAATAPAFFSDENTNLVATVVNATEIGWLDPTAGSPTGPEPVDPTDPAAMASAVARVDYPDSSVEYWYTLQDAFTSLEGKSGHATVTLVNDGWLLDDLVVPCDVELVSSSASVRHVVRYGDCSVVVGDGASLSVSDVVFSDSGVLSFSPPGNPFFAVAGGSLEFLDGTKVSNVVAYGRFGSAVTVTAGETAGGTFTMHDGSAIENCVNGYEYVFDGTAYAGGLLVSGANMDGTVLTARAYLLGGVITNCAAYRSGGVYVGSRGEVHVSGDVEVVGNFSTTNGVAAFPANMTVSANAALVLDGMLTGDVCVSRDIAGDKVVFGRIGESFSGTDADRAASAMNFTSDDGFGYGVTVDADGSGVATHLAWVENLGVDGSYTDRNGVVYSLVSDPSVPLPVDPPTAVEGLVYNGEEQSGVVQHLGYSFSGEIFATTAGTYSATATLSPGYAWSDSSTGAKAVVWTIAKAAYDMGGVSFADATFIYDGTSKSLEISGELPDGVTVEYSSNSWSLPGAYTVTASFFGDSDNYLPIPDKTATLKIVTTVVKPSATTGLVYNAVLQTGVEPGPGYSLTGDVAGTDAGTNFTAIATLDDFKVWADGSTNAVEITWSIGPAPLAVVASNAWKYVDAADPLPFAYGVDGLQGSDTAEDVLVGALDRIPGERISSYYITQGSLAVRDGVSNYYLASFTMGTFKIRKVSASVLPELPPSPTASDVAAALVEAGLADAGVAAAITNDPGQAVAAYNDFKEWAGDVDGGEEAVQGSDKAWVSYEFGVTELFENEPTVTFTSMAIEDPANASMNVKIVVKDGTAEKVVDPESVAKLFEMSTNLVTWTDDVTATPNPDGSYTVKPNDPALSAAFIRLKY